MIILELRSGYLHIAEIGKKYKIMKDRSRLTLIRKRCNKNWQSLSKTDIMFHMFENMFKIIMHYGT